jgi:hypothetical protein
VLESAQTIKTRLFFEDHSNRALPRELFCTIGRLLWANADACKMPLRRIFLVKEAARIGCQLSDEAVSFGGKHCNWIGKCRSCLHVVEREFFSFRC